MIKQCQTYACASDDNITFVYHSPILRGVKEELRISATDNPPSIFHGFGDCMRPMCPIRVHPRRVGYCSKEEARKPKVTFTITNLLFVL